MAVIVLPQATPGAAGVEITPVTLTATDTFTFRNSGRTRLVIRHGTPASVAVDNAVTVITPGKAAPNLAIADYARPIPAGKVVVIAGLENNVFGDGALVSFTAAGTDVATMTAYALD